MSETKRSLKVFLCHAHDDKLKTRELYRYLRKRGIQPWLDAEDLVGGQDWRVEIPKAIRTSDAIIICLSKNSINKEGFVQAEITFALEKALEIPQGRIFIIPARFEDCEVPNNLERFHWVDLFEKDGFPRLMKSLRTRAGQLERSTVQIPQPDETSPNLNSALEEKIESEAALEKIEREAAEKTAREKAEKETAEKVRLEAEEQEKQKATKEKAEREATEKVAREKAEKEAAEKARLEADELAKQKIAKEKAEREAAEKAAPKTVPVEEKQTNILIPKVNKPESKKIKRSNNSAVLNIGIFLATIFLAGFSINLFAQKVFTPQQTATQTVSNPTAVARTAVAELTLTAAAFTATLLPTETPFIISTKAFTPTITPIVNWGDGCNNAIYISDVTIPDGTQMSRSQVFLKTWKIQNSGTCSWGESYQIIFDYGEKMSGQPQILLGSIAPGQAVDVSVQFTAPNQVGEYISAWRMTNASGISFGDTLLVKIIIK